MGETCGLKMINTNLPLQGDCRLCQQISIKKRKLQKAIDDFNRFKVDPTRRATAEVRMREIQQLQYEIKALEDDRQARINKVGNSRRADYRQA